MKKFSKIVLFILVLCLIGILIVTIVQLNGQSNLEKCTYLDPIAIDIAAFLAGIFLFVEGFYRVYENKKDSFKRQFTRALRIALGCTIITVHIIQFLHK